MDAFYTHHVLHALGIAKVYTFQPGTRVMDVGTGGGFPGIPLAILFPDVEFHLIDSIGKKIKVVNTVVEALKLPNVKTYHDRVEHFSSTVDYAVCRAVAPMETLVYWAGKKIAKTHRNTWRNGLLCLKGGDLNEELKNFPKAKIYALRDYFTDAFFQTKKVVYLPID